MRPIGLYSFQGIWARADLAYCGESRWIRNDSKSKGQSIMLNWAITFLVIALVAAVLGFTGVAVAAAGIAKLIFVVFVILFLVSLIGHFGRAGSRV
jgi:uncharacterized membrane protein YtjA (UPF0391 family)